MSYFLYVYTATDIFVLCVGLFFIYMIDVQSQVRVYWLFNMAYPEILGFIAFFS